MIQRILPLLLATACSAAATDPTNDPNASSEDALSPGSASGPTKLSVPAQIASLRSDPHVIAGYLDVTHYGADPTGVKDSTSAFQNALNDAGSNAHGSIGASMVVFVPSGTYKISKTLTGYQIFNGSNTNLVNSKYGAGNGILAPSLVGPGSGPRPTIVLADGTFEDATHPAPMLHMVNTPNAGPGGCGGQWAGSTDVGCFDILFNAVVRDIDFKVGKNPGAIGVEFYSAQMSYMQNVKVDATGGYAGIEGAPATEAWVNIEVDGGQYGVIVDRTAGTSAIAGLVLANQTTAGVRFGAIGDLSITGFDIREPSATVPGVLTSERVNQGSHLTMIDGFLTTGGAPAIDNAGNLSVYVANAWLDSPHTLFLNGSTAVAAKGAMQDIREYAHADPTTNGTSVGYPLAATNVVNDKKQSTDVGPIFGTASVPTDLVARNVPSGMPWAFDAKVVWVTDHGADPTGATDSTSAFRAAISTAHALGSDEVFVPRGHYTFSSTVVLYPNTKLFGLPGGYSQLGAPNWNPGTGIGYVLQVGDSASNASGTLAGKAIVSDLDFGLSTLGNANVSATAQSHLAAIKWETGSHSIGNQLWVGFQYNSGLRIAAPSRDIVRIDGGGGRFYGMQIVGDWGPNGSSGHSLLVTNTKQRTSIYGSNIEHAAGESFYGIVNASNVRVLGAKAEDGAAGHWFHVTGSSNVMISGLSNHDSRLNVLIDGGSTNVNVNTMGFYANTTFSTPRITDAVATYSFADAYALFEDGTFDDSIFANP